MGVTFRQTLLPGDICLPLLVVLVLSFMAGLPPVADGFRKVLEAVVAAAAVLLPAVPMVVALPVWR